MHINCLKITLFFFCFCCFSFFMKIVVPLALVVGVASAALDPMELASPFVGTGGAGYGCAGQFPGAQVPFGSVRLSPDTAWIDGKVRRIGTKKKNKKKKQLQTNKKKNKYAPRLNPPPPQDLAFCHTGGYAYGNEELLAFSHLHMVGAGVTDLGNVGVMPLAGPFREACAAPRASCPGRLSKPTERASPGYYTSSVLLQGDAGSGEVLAELTASKSTGYHRYTFDAGSTARTIVIDMGHTLDGKACKNSSMTAEPLTEPGVSPARWAVDAVMHSEGSYSGRFGGFQLFVAAQIEEVGDEDGSGGKGAGGGGRDGATAAPPISTKARVAMWDSVSPGTINWDAKALAGTMVGTALQFGPGARPIEMRLAVSFISAAQARANLAADLAAAPDFDAARAAAEAEWRAVLARVTVADGDQASRASLQVLYTALYHAHMAPTTLSEAGGTYLGLDKRPHHVHLGHPPHAGTAAHAAEPRGADRRRAQPRADVPRRRRSAQVAVSRRVYGRDDRHARQRHHRRRHEQGARPRRWATER
jgi:putative alpha-1,2-mannosidase